MGYRPFLAMLAAVALGSAPPAPKDASKDAPPEETWSFAVSGDSRDCGDLVMPKIARAIGEETPPVDFYWHLGDYRRMYDVDCDFVKREHPSFDCATRPWEELPDGAMSAYLSVAWQDFIDRQLAPFAPLPVILGIGNHELYAGRTRDDYRRAFQPWLTQRRLHVQRLADAAKNNRTNAGETYYHFVHRGVDFIQLDNADDAAFPPAQLLWLTKVLAEDAKDDSVRTIVAGMHAALPYSKVRGHAMDQTCQGRCSGQSVYDLLFRAQRLAAPDAKKKRVYVLASHAHEFVERPYDTPEHHGQELDGWVIGTAGAVQDRPVISYGYLRADVGKDGALAGRFREVGRASPPLASGPGAEELTRFCFEENNRKAGSEGTPSDCACGAR